MEAFPLTESAHMRLPTRQALKLLFPTKAGNAFTRNGTKALPLMESGHARQSMRQMLMPRFPVRG